MEPSSSVSLFQQLSSQNENTLWLAFLIMVFILIEYSWVLELKSQILHVSPPKCWKVFRVTIIIINISWALIVCQILWMFFVSITSLESCKIPQNWHLKDNSVPEWCYLKKCNLPSQISKVFKEKYSFLALVFNGHERDFLY